MKLTKSDLNKAVQLDINETLVELVRCVEQININEKLLHESNTPKDQVDRINEGLWEKVKYGLAKLGRYKAGGKILGKGKIDQEAGAKIQSIIDKKGNEVIKALHTQLKSSNPEFPNNEKGDDFLKTILEISAVYDTLVASTKKDPKDEGFLPIDIANGIIEDLADYVKKYLDVDLSAAYSVMDSEEDEVDDDGNVDDGKKELIADDLMDINEEDDDLDAGDVRKQLQSKKGEGSKDRESERMKTLKSNKLPLLLAGVGASLGAFSWLTNTEWFKHLFEETFKYTDTEQIRDVIQTKTEILNDIKPGEGVYKLLGRVTDHPLDGNSSPSEMIDALKQIGGGDANKGIDLLCQDGGVMMKPTEAAKGLHDLVNNPDQYNKLGDLFKGTASGTGKLVEPGTGLNTTSYGTIAGKSLTSMLVKNLPIIITKVVTKTGIKMGAGYAVAKGFGAVLGPIGIGLVAAGALVKVMRMKGSRQSRAKTLNDLYQSIQPIKGTEENIPVLPPKPEEEKPKGGEEVNGGEDNNSTQTPVVPQDFLKGNRNMQLAYLAELFLPKGKGLWDKLGIKKGTVIPSGFLDAALGQGKKDSKKYLKAYYNHLKKENSFTKDPGNSGAWVTKVRANDTQSLIKWVRNTRKNIGPFLNALNKEFPEFQIGKRAKVKTTKPGKRGEAMGTSGINDSIENRLSNLLTEDVNLGGSAAKAGFDKSIFMKNLPQFMEMISSMYYGIKGTKLSYSKEGVLKTCKSFGCKLGSGSGYKKSKSDDYVLQSESKFSYDKNLNEEVSKMKNLINRIIK